MKINNNISAVLTNNQLLRNENSLSKSMERLSSGLKLNHASDNPSGMAISKKMAAQIDGLDRASQNASDGISVVQTADGALGEVTNMLQRIRELSVQAADDINTDQDRDSIQVEIDSLKEEIDRISSATEFNTKNLLDGSLDARVYGNNGSRFYASSSVASGQYSLTVNTAATQAQLNTSFTITDTTTITAAQAGIVSINGYSVELKEDMTGQEIYMALREGAERAEANVSDYGSSMTFKSNKYGGTAEVTLDFSNDDLASLFGYTNTSVSAAGVNADITLDRTTAFSNQATYAVEGNKVIITDNAGFEISFMAETDYTGQIDLNVTDIGPMDIQIGANSGQNMTVRIPACDTKSIYIHDVDVSPVNGGREAIAKVDEALDRIDKTRAAIGAFQNRLEYSVASLDDTEENMTAALSRIEDVDMAEEMVEYTKYNVLEQAATSALSQANEIPNLALQLLQ